MTCDESLIRQMTTSFLRYLYTDEFFPEADTVLATLYAAKKYIVPFLARACVSYLETSLTAGNACLLLSQSRLFEEPELMQRCWEIIDAQVTADIMSEYIRQSFVMLASSFESIGIRPITPDTVTTPRQCDML